jgi:hypothetical protein
MIALLSHGVLEVSMKRQIYLLAALLALICWVAFAADIDGTWSAQVEGRGGPQTQTLTLKADGNMLKGSIGGGRGGPVDISNGKVDGPSVSFSVVREFNGNSITQEYKGTLSGAELKLTMTGGRGGPVEMVFKKGS